MPIIQSQITLSETTPSLVVSPDNMPQEVHLHNMTKSANEYIFLGDENVSTTNAIHIDPGESIQLSLPALDSLYAVSDPGGLVLGVLVLRRRD